MVAPNQRVIRYTMNPDRSAKPMLPSIPATNHSCRPMASDAPVAPAGGRQTPPFGSYLHEGQAAMGDRLLPASWASLTAAWSASSGLKSGASIDVSLSPSGFRPLLLPAGETENHQARRGYTVCDASNAEAAG